MMNFEISGISHASHHEEKVTRLQQVVTTVSSVSPPEALRALTGLAADITEFFKGILPSIQESASIIAKSLESLTGGLAIISLIGHLRFWVCDKPVSIHEAISMIFFGVYGCIKTVTFMAGQGLYSLGKIASSVGGIPVLNVVSSGIAVIGTVFNGIKNYKQIRTLHSQMHGDETYLAGLRSTMKEYVKSLEVHVKFPELTAELANWENIVHLNRAALDTVEKRIHNELFENIVNFALLALVVTSLLGGGGAFLMMTGPMMLTLNALVSTFWLYRCFHDAANKNINIDIREESGYKFNANNNSFAELKEEFRLKEEFKVEEVLMLPPLPEGSVYRLDDYPVGHPDRLVI